MSHPLELVQAVHHNAAKVHVQGTVDLSVRLVIAMQTQILTLDPSPCGNSQLATRAGVQTQAFRVHPAGDLGGQECLACVVHVHAAANVLECVVKGVLEHPRPSAEVVLAHDEQGRAKLCLELADRDSADGEFAVSAAFDVVRPHGRNQFIQITGGRQPTGG